MQLGLFDLTAAAGTDIPSLFDLDTIHTDHGTEPAGTSGLLDAYVTTPRQASLSDCLVSEVPNAIVNPPATGTWTKFSDPGVRALAVAAAVGRVNRGGADDEASIATLKSLAKRGALVLTYQARTDARKVVTGGTVTGFGRRVLAEAEAAADLAARRARLVAG